MNVRNFILICILSLSFAMPVYAVEDAAYVTPDAWRQHITSSGVRMSTGGVDIGNGYLKLGLTTRGYFNLHDGDSNNNIYQYFRARLTDTELGNGVVSANLNVRGAWNGNARNTSSREHHVFYDSLDIEKWQTEDLSLRLYHANVLLESVVPYVDVTVGRIYLDTLNDYKVDGIKLYSNSLDALTVGAYYGLPVSYYTDLETQVVGGYVDVPLDSTDTKVRGEYSYVISSEDSNTNTHVVKARVDQYYSYGDMLYGSAYIDGAMIGNAYLYDAGFNTNIVSSRSNFSAYVLGQAGMNKDGSVNPYVSSYESVLGAEEEFIMAGALISQGITDFLMLSLGYEKRYTFDNNYGSRDYDRVFATIDLVGLIHHNNFISVIFDWYNMPSYLRQDKDTLEIFAGNGETQFLGGLRMSQVVSETVDFWLGANVMNYQYKNSPIKYVANSFAPGALNTLDEDRSENTAMGYVGGMWKINDWCIVQADYMFEYSSIFNEYNMSDNAHIVEAWINFLW